MNPLLTRFLLASPLVAGLVVAGRAAPAALARVDVFQVRHVVVEGARFVDTTELRVHARIPDTASVWHDPAPWARRIVAHPMVVEADVGRRLPATLVVRVEEREPVALAATPTLEPVDREGRLLPLDPTRVRLDLPVIRVAPDPSFPEGAPPPPRLRPVARAVERLRVDPEFFAGLSAVELDGEGGLVARWGSAPQVVFRLALPVDPRRLREGLVVLADALERFPDRTPHVVDLRRVEQVVVDFCPRGERRCVPT
jgi:cell division protein FtsQ